MTDHALIMFAIIHRSLPLEAINKELSRHESNSTGGRDQRFAARQQAEAPGTTRMDLWNK